MTKQRIVIAGGGASGFFAAVTCAETTPHKTVCLLEKGPQFLSKVRISGGGRCNVTHACFDPGELSGYYPRGGAALRGAFHRFQPRDTIAWFEARGVRLKTEQDGRMFPVTNTSETILDCLLAAARNAGIEFIANRGVRSVARCPPGGFELQTADGGTLACDRLMLATGGCRGPAAGELAESLGHTVAPPVPSLFTFEVADPWLRELSGISMASVEVTAPDLGLRERGPVLITHAGLSGPAILRLSAWGARLLHDANYRFRLQLNWIPHLLPDALAAQLESLRATQGARLLVNTPFPPLAMRLWQKLVSASGLSRETRWAGLSRSAQHQLVQQLIRTQLQVTGKTLNRDEFVTCGGVRLSEVNFKTMESRLCPGLYFGGELLDIDGLTGGFNFQSAWTTGWLAGKAMADQAD